MARLLVRFRAVVVAVAFLLTGFRLRATFAVRFAGVLEAPFFVFFAIVLTL